MPQRYVEDESFTDSSNAVLTASRSIFSSFSLQPAYALRAALKEGYNAEKLRADLMAGIVVGIIALPLAMALAIASGVPPQYGAYTSIVCGAFIALLGGSRTQVSGPTAAFVVILTPIAGKFGLGGLLLASLMAGFILVGCSLARMGRFIEYIPSPVTTGFTSGIAVVIAVLQLKDFFGLTIARMPDHFHERVLALSHALPTLHWADLTIGLVTLAILLLWPKLSTRIPAPLVALSFAALIAFLLGRYLQGFNVATIGSRFSYVVNGISYSGIPRTPPLPSLPWLFPDASGHPIGISFNLIRELLPSAFAIAALGAIESLLSAVVSDGMSNTRHDPDAELFAQGVGNIVGPFFGAFAATGAIARTATNIRSGGRSPIAAITHAIFVLLAILVLAPLVAYLPMASLAALLLLVAWNMSEIKHFIHIIRIAPRSDLLVLLACFSLTVVFDMVVGVTIGLMLSSILFMHRMAETSKVKVIAEHHPTLPRPLPANTILYEISGPLFFGAAQRAMSALGAIGNSTRTVILYIGAVQMIDATGLINLESALKQLRRSGIFVILTGVRRQPASVLAKAGIAADEDNIAICQGFNNALQLAEERSQRPRKTGKLVKNSGKLVPKTIST